MTIGGTQNQARGPTWRWVVGVALLLITALGGIVVRGAATELERASVINTSQSLEIALLRQRVVTDSAQLADFRKEVNEKLDRLLNAIGNAAYRPPRRQ